MKKWVAAVLSVLVITFGFQMFGHDNTANNHSTDKQQTDTVPPDKKNSSNESSQSTVVSQALQMDLHTNIPDHLPLRNHAFVVLGSALKEDGTISEKLLQRLEIARKAAEKYSKSRIILTGGKSRNGISEAEAMYNWLVSHGIQDHRILKENQSEDTVQNARYTFRIIKDKNIKHITLITSASHIRRAFAVFSEMDLQYHNVLSSSITHIVNMDINQEKSDHLSSIDKAKIYLDVLRAKEQ